MYGRKNENNINDEGRGRRIYLSIIYLKTCRINLLICNCMNVGGGEFTKTT